MIALDRLRPGFLGALPKFCFVAAAFLVATRSTETVAQGAVLARTDSVPLRHFQHRSPVVGVRFLPKGDRLVTATLDGKVRVWDVRRDRLVTVTTAHPSSILALDVSPNGQLLVTSGDDGSVGIWDLSGQLIHLRRRLYLAPWCSAVRFHPAGLLVLGCSDLSVRVLDPVTGNEVRRISVPGNAQYGSVDAVSISPDGHLLATSSPLRIWNWASGKIEKEVGAVLPLSISFSPTNTRLAAGSMVAGGSVWDIGTGVLSTRLSAKVTKRVWGGASFPTVDINMPIVGIAYSPTSEEIAGGGVDNVIQLWTGEPASPLTPVARLQFHQGTISELTFSPDGRLLASSSLDGMVTVWQVH